MHRFYPHLITLLLTTLIGVNHLYSQCSCTSGIGDQNSLQLYWVGGNSNNYNDICNWRLNAISGTEVPCQAPRSNDNVFFMNGAFSGTSNTITIDQNSNCDTMIWDNAITTTKGVSLTGINAGVSLDIYGNLELATNMNVASFNGKLRFTCVQNKIVYFQSRGQNLRLENLYVELGANAELRLVDKLTVNNRSNNNIRRDEGGITLNSGHFNTNGQDINADRIYSRNGNTTRQMTIDNSHLSLDGKMYTFSGWAIDFNTTNNSGFSSTNSHVNINSTSYSTVQYYSFGTGITYDSITIDVEMGRHFLYPACNINCHYFEVGAGTVPITGYYSTINSDHFKIGANAMVYNLNLTTDNFHGPSACETAVIHNINLNKKTTGGTLNINNIVAQNVDGTIGNTYLATTCYEGGSCSNITFNPISSCNSDLRFTDAAGDQDWQNIANWVNHNTSAAATHIPTPWSNVYFDANSFPNATKKVYLNNPAFCKDMRWLNTPTGADLELTHHLFLNGDLELDDNMAPINQSRIGHEYSRGIICMSPNNDSIISKGIHIYSAIHFMDFSRYHIIDTLYTSLLYQHGGSSYLTIRNANLQIANYIYFYNSTWDNATLNYTGGGWTGIGSGGSPGPTFTNSTFYLNNTGSLMIGAKMPNVVVNGSGKVFAHGYMGIEGDLTINTNSMSSMKDAYNYSSNGRIDVSGNVNIAAGVGIMLNSNTGSYMRVQGDIYTVGNCASGLTSIRTDVGNPVEFTVNGTGSNLQGVFLQGLDASAGQALTAANSTDGGNNTNINFTLGTGQTFYWAEDMTNLGDLTGLWSNANHWTTTLGKTTGDGTCIPSIVDTVIFARTGSNCTIDGNAFCKNFETKTTVTLLSSSANNNLYIAGDLITDANTDNRYYGRINLVGSGNINTNGVDLTCKELIFNKVGGTWDLQNNLRMNRNTSDVYYNHFVLAAGTINANGHNIFVKHRFSSTSNNVRALNLNNSTFQIGATANYNGYPRALWNASNSANLTINGGLIHIMAGNNHVYKSIHFGDNNLTYDSVLIESNGFEMPIYGTTSFNHAEWDSDLLIRGNNNYDTLVLNGGHKYRFLTNTTQTLNAPHGKLKSKNTGPSNFINLESTIVGQLASIHKEYGESFCLNYIKVKDVKATKAATQPAACTQPDCWSLLEFQSDQNSDSISILNSDWGVWRFKLAPLINPISSGVDTVIICKTGSNLSYPIKITGSSPYIIDYNWQDATNPSINGGQSGILVYDDDNNPNTPYTYNVPLNPIVSRFNYTVDIATTRCGNRILSSPVNTHVIVPTPNQLVQTNRTGSCTFENEGNWYSILDAVDDRPIASLLDSTNVTDNDSLGLVNVEVLFEPTVQNLTYNGSVYPYLQRHWQITPTRNHSARVRLYFTQQELDALGLGSFAATYNGGVNPATELLVLKYNDGTFGTATTAPNVVMVPHTVIAANATDWAANPTAAVPFSNTNDIIAIEFEVSSFSHFAIVLTQDALLNVPNLLNFDANIYEQNQVKTIWDMKNVDEVEQFIVQHTTDYSTITDKTSLAPIQGLLQYHFIDKLPNLGLNYYRLKNVLKNGDISYSKWKAVTLETSNLVTIYPNPTAATLYAKVYSAQNSFLKWKVMNSLGQLVLSGEHTIGTGIQTVSIPTHALAAGMYTLLLEDKRTSFVQQHSFIKQ